MVPKPTIANQHQRQKLEQTCRYYARVIRVTMRTSVACLESLSIEAILWSFPERAAALLMIMHPEQSVFV